MIDIFFILIPNGNFAGEPFASPGTRGSDGETPCWHNGVLASYAASLSLYL
jgi:hypothetical protein